MSTQAVHATLISADCHCGADVMGYRPYLESRFHEEFDAWAANYGDPWIEIESENLEELVEDDERRLGIASANLQMNWDGAHRNKYLEEQGIIAEVLFPNTAPPFYPSGVITAPAPVNQSDYDRRWAGLRAHNRWLAEFCADLPGRRAGFAQLFLDDVDAAIAEVEWARDAGLKGVLLPTDHVSKLVNLYYPELDRLWAVCAESGLPIHRHGSLPTEYKTIGGVASPWIGVAECGFFLNRGLVHLILSGAFQRHPDLKLVIAEGTSAAAIPALVAELDAVFEGAHAGNRSFNFMADAVASLDRRPSEFLDTNCFFGGPFDVGRAYQSGIANVMWGADIPHSEGTGKHTKEALRKVFAPLGREALRTVCAETAAKLYGFDLDYLDPIAEKVCFRYDEILDPIGADELPADSRCAMLWMN